MMEEGLAGKSKALSLCILQAELPWVGRPTAAEDSAATRVRGFEACGEGHPLALLSGSVIHACRSTSN